jgi:hypothetical protein
MISLAYNELELLQSRPTFVNKCICSSGPKTAVFIVLTRKITSVSICIGINQNSWSHVTNYHHQIFITLDSEILKSNFTDKNYTILVLIQYFYLLNIKFIQKWRRFPPCTLMIRPYKVAQVILFKAGLLFHRIK